MAHETEITEILTRVTPWPEADRLALARRLVRITTPGPTEPNVDVKAKQPGLISLVGIANRNGQQWTDAELDQLRLDAILEKHLR